MLVLGALALLLPAASGLTHEQFQPPRGALIAGLRETAAHRPAPPPLRLSRHHDAQEDLRVWLHIDPQGNVLDVHAMEKSDVDSAALQNAVRKLRYTPFTRDGAPVEAWAQDFFSILEVEDLPAHVVAFPRITDVSAVRIRLSRTGCNGGCPVYSVTINGDGSIEYAGDHSVSITGDHEARISTADFAALLDRFRQADFLALKDAYRSEVTGNATYYLSINLPGKTKVVMDYMGGWVGMPAVVTELEDAVDQAADSARWVSSSSETIAAMRKAGIALTSPQATRILRAAVSAGDIVTVRALLAAGTPVSPDQTPAQFEVTGGTQLHELSLLELAASSDGVAGQLEILQALLASPALRADQAGKQRALARAAQLGHADAARALVAAGADPSARFTGESAETEPDESYLMLAASSGVWAMIDDALARPHDIHDVDSQGHTALVSLVLSAPPNEDIFPLIDRLLAAGADHTDLDRVLLSSCQSTWIHGLVARGGNINARGANGNTPLFQSCSVEEVQAMLDAGADPSLHNVDNKTAVEATYPPEGGVEDPRAAVIRRFMETHSFPKPD